ncbi:putative hydratase [Dimargaris cristalligena]|uniref:Putative hydratase n=1 Tax=Dimargaris cristalligena TaxID=215637 RepID=A0A4P9ZJW1_9FUNG|nr:putative hydratase [Dimargaris cristalligena]|eukprot:RKP33514.1 putative hydratase [Dimargaris cristalligena]
MGDAVLRALHPLLDGLNSADDSLVRPLLLQRPVGRRGMTICEKILAHNAINLPAPGHVAPGDMVCVSVEWTVSSEASLVGMNKTYELMGRPGVNRNDRLWLAVDHTVDPRTMDRPLVQKLVQLSEDFAKEVNLVDYYRPNYTIIHTEFYRERAQPGQIVIGADSHTCSAGAVGAFALGLGAADVVMPLVTGETWFKVPETINIRFEGKPRFGVGGKDIILYVLGKLKRNTVAMERAVEYTGPGLDFLSCDARFAIANMTTEFGGIAGVFEADETTAAFIAKRTNPEHKNSSLYFRADPDAQYVETHVIDLGDIAPLVALYPSPDNVVPITETLDMKLDGVFIGACTTAEEDLVLGALVLEAGLKLGKVPVATGKRRVTPGSVPILAKLRRLGLLRVYEQAGFDIGTPGCSYCIAMAADKALAGEVWLSSQNRNFKNRMGPGSIANLASAASVAASSFDMAVTDPTDLLNTIDLTRLKKALDLWMEKPVVRLTVSEPSPAAISEGPVAPGSASPSVTSSPAAAHSLPSISGRVQRFGDNVDTDQIIPAQFCGTFNEEELGHGCFGLVRPEFRERVKQGATIVVADEGFGSGSSREEAPRALKSIGVKAVIAKSFAFIYARNQPNMSLLGITLKDPEFYALAQEGAELVIDVAKRTVTIGNKKFPFVLSQMEERLLSGGGVTAMYNKYGSKLFRAAISDNPEQFAGCGSADQSKVARPVDEKLGDGGHCDQESQAILAW